MPVGRADFAGMTYFLCSEIRRSAEDPADFSPTLRILLTTDLIIGPRTDVEGRTGGDLRYFQFIQLPKERSVNMEN